jgi:predicted TIM-barrel fold metal-dependent hydrolase
MHDCHAHVIGPGPHDPDWPHDTPPAPLDDFLATLDANRVARAVLVQPRAAGFDNALILDAVARHPDRLRGVAVVPEDAAADHLARLHAAGMRGVRLGGKTPLAALPALAPRLARAGLHAQLLMRGPDLLAMRGAIAECPVPVVIDHLAHPDPAEGTGGPAFAALLDLLGAGHVFAKLSAVFRFAARPDLSDAAALLREAIRRCPSRLVWGSDWPFLNQAPPGPSYAVQLCHARDLAGPEEWSRIADGTPRVLYGF